jgi:hypothetical protein
VKKLIAPLMLAAALFTTGCETSNQYGACKGLASYDEKDPSLHYSYSTRNIILSVLFSETLLWPGITAAFWLKCPDYRLAAPGSK